MIAAAADAIEGTTDASFGFEDGREWLAALGRALPKLRKFYRYLEACQHGRRAAQS
jgi:hypothetical protein